ncbi:MAG: serine hydrolase domain-containing protein [Pseudomonadota bacterium]|nr:serine hydrolase domain-containing protein [Pseudomonadota bacterium]
MTDTTSAAGPAPAPVVPSPVIPSIAEALANAVAAGHTVGAVALVADRDGVLHSSAHGRRAADDDAPMTVDTVFRLFSMTKAIGTVAALRMAEQGRLDLDAPVADLVPALSGARVFAGMVDGAPAFRAPATPVTARHLATHTSGLVYDQWHAGQAALTAHMREAGTASARIEDVALQFDPGTEWGYGQSTDWLGMAAEAAAGRPIRELLADEILGPLGMTATDVIFRDDMQPRAAFHVPAKSGGGFARFDIDGPADAPPPAFHGMGGCMKGSGPDYIRFLRMILRGGELDGARILAPETVRLMMENGIGDLRVRPMATTDPNRSADLALFPGVEQTFTLGFLRVEEDVEGRRRAGSVGWAGLLNTHFWIDPARGLCAVLMMQQAPFLSADAMAVYDAFERAVCAHADAA